MVDDPTAPMSALPAQIAADAADLAGTIAPYCFALLTALVILTMAGRLIREMR